MTHNLQIRKINEDKFMVSVNDTNKIFVDEIYFCGKEGSDCGDFAEAARNYTKTENEDRIRTIKLSDLRTLEPIDNFLIIFVDTPFKFRFERLLDIFSAERINKMVEKENDAFVDINTLLQKFKHLIIQ